MRQDRFRPIVAEIVRLTEDLERDEKPDAEAWNQLLLRWDREGEDSNRRYDRFKKSHARYTRRLTLASAISRTWKLPYEGEALVAEIKPKVDQVLLNYKALLDEYRAALERFGAASKARGLA